MTSILVIGCVSFDTIHLDQGAGRQTYQTIGGAGLFTALAAAHAGAQVTLYAPKPNNLPSQLTFVDKAINWIGPLVDADQMPTLEIVHHGQGRASLIAASWGPEKLLLPRSLSNEFKLKNNKGNRKDQSKEQIKENCFDAIHIAALSTPERQFQFFQHLKECNASTLLSVGTYARAITADCKTVSNLLQSSEVFFMNSNEANLLLNGVTINPKSGQLIFVTDGENGSTIYSAQTVEHIEASKATELDPTGAGDTFCGATLAGLAQQLDAAASALIGSQLAAKIIEHPGSSFYF